MLTYAVAAGLWARPNPRLHVCVERQSLCRYLKKSAAAAGSRPDEDTNAEFVVFISSTSWLFFPQTGERVVSLSGFGVRMMGPCGC